MTGWSWRYDNLKNRTEQNRTEQNRTEYIDIFRALGIVLMILGHVGLGEYFSKFIHAFHMPMFFIVSGIFFSTKNTPKNFLIKKIKTLLIPYIIFGLFHYLVYVVLYWTDVEVTPLIHLLSVNTDGIFICGALWFLTAMFFSNVIYYLICRYVSNEIVIHIIVAAIAIFGCLACIILPFRLPYALDASFVGVGLMHIGHIIMIYKEKLYSIVDLKKYKIFLTGLIVTILIFINGDVNMRTGNYAIIPLFWINAVSASIVGLSIAKQITKYIPQRLRYYLTSIGQNSIIYLCLNQIVIIGARYLISNLTSSTLIEKCFIFFVTMIVLYFCEKIILKSPLRVIVGKTL